MCINADILSISLRYSCVCVCVIFYDNTCQGDTRAKCSPYWRLMCFRQATGGTPAQALNPWERGPQSPCGSEWKNVRSSRVCLSARVCVCVGQLERVSVQSVVGVFLGVGVRITKRQATYSKYADRKRTKVRLILLISGITDVFFKPFYLCSFVSPRPCYLILLSCLFTVCLSKCMTQQQGTQADHFLELVHMG